MEVVTVHRAKGLEYPIVVVGDLLTSAFPGSNAILDHKLGQGWLRIGPFKPADWDARVAWDESQQEAEGRRLLYVALTRARDHLVIPCLPGERRDSWLDQACAGFAAAGEKPPFGKIARTVSEGGKSTAQVTWFDSRKLAFDVAPAKPHSTTSVVEGKAAQAITAIEAERQWETARTETRARARAQVDGAERPSTLTKDATDTGDERDPRFGNLVHELLATVPLDAKDVRSIAEVLGRTYALTEQESARAARLVELTLALPLLESPRTAARCRREIPLTCTVDGREIVGRIDLAFQRDHGWTIVDYKSEPVGDDAAKAAEHHRPQLDAYRRAFSRLVGAGVQAALCFIHSQQVVVLGEAPKTPAGSE